jgi:hypothetical protein
MDKLINKLIKFLGGYTKEEYTAVQGEVQKFTICVDGGKVWIE